MPLSAFYYTYDLLNMFRAPLCSSSGAHDYIPLFTTWNVCFLGLHGGEVWVGWLCGEQYNRELLMISIEVPETC
jgi:uncharacterized membrane protein YecN with MAPEG domain